MKKSKFEKKLFKKLGSLPKAEKIKIIEYYNELYLDQKELGKSDEEIIAEWGNPSDIAFKVLNEDANEIELSEKVLNGIAESKSDKDETETPFKGDNGEKGRQNKKTVQKPSYRSNGGKTSMENGKRETKCISIFKSKIFWIVYFAGFYVTIPLTIALVSVALALAISLFATVAALIVGGAGSSVVGIITMFYSLNDGLLTFGAGLIALGAGLLCLYILGVLGRFFKKKK
ncbi:MAG: DUF1700 domain-containing protein [Clostridiales bacterium]|jgi:uncharacterized membrane protein|nr:DUF1700 domain-containing protein [Clostridiales bacterium]